TDSAQALSSARRSGGSSTATGRPQLHRLCLAAPYGGRAAILPGVVPGERPLHTIWQIHELVVALWGNGQLYAAARRSPLNGCHLRPATACITPNTNAATAAAMITTAGSTISNRNTSDGFLTCTSGWSSHLMILTMAGGCHAVSGLSLNQFNT